MQGYAIITCTPFTIGLNWMLILSKRNYKFNGSYKYKTTDLTAFLSTDCKIVIFIWNEQNYLYCLPNSQSKGKQFLNEKWEDTHTFYN